MAALDGLAKVSDPAVTDTPGIFASFFGPDPLNLLFVVILTSLGTWGLPQMVQKFYAIKDEKSIKKGTIISTIFALVVAGGSYFLGGFGRLFSDEIDVAANGYDSIIPTNAFRIKSYAYRTCCYSRFVSVNVYAFITCNCIKFNTYYRLLKR